MAESIMNQPAMKSSMNKPVAESCLRNQEPIANALAELLTKESFLLELGSGTGQHAVYCAERLPHVSWQPSDLIENIPGIQAWMEEAKLANILPPLVLDVEQLWPVEQVDAVFTANTVHYVPWETVKMMFQGVGRVLLKGGLFMIYGPVNEQDRFTSEGNARLDAWLKSCVNPAAGIKDIDQLKLLAMQNGMKVIENISMPANNRLLVLQK